MCVRLTEVTLKSHWQTAEKESSTGFQSWEMSQTHREEQNQISGTYIYTHSEVESNELHLLALL